MFDLNMVMIATLCSLEIDLAGGNGDSNKSGKRDGAQNGDGMRAQLIKSKRLARQELHLRHINLFKPYVPWTKKRYLRSGGFSITDSKIFDVCLFENLNSKVRSF